MSTVMRTESRRFHTHPWWVAAVVATVVLWGFGWAVVFTDLPAALPGFGGERCALRTSPALSLAIAAAPLATSYGWVFLGSSTGQRRSGVLAVAVSFGWVVVVGVVAVASSLQPFGGC